MSMFASQIDAAAAPVLAQTKANPSKPSAADAVVLQTGDRRDQRSCARYRNHDTPGRPPAALEAKVGFTFPRMGVMAELGRAPPPRIVGIDAPAS
jgi:hypothetical protein